MKTLKKTLLALTVLLTMSISGAYAHCDSYDGPVILDAYKALETNNVNLVHKWISKAQEPEINELFALTLKIKTTNKEAYPIVEKHFLETLVRLHRETEKAPYTGLKEAGTTAPITQLSDGAIAKNNIDHVSSPLTNHIMAVISEKFDKVKNLEAVKDQSAENGRKYVAAYVDYTHTIEALHNVLDGNHAH